MMGEPGRRGERETAQGGRKTRENEGRGGGERGRQRKEVGRLGK